MPLSDYKADNASLFREPTLQPIAGITALDGTGKTVPILVTTAGLVMTQEALPTGAATSANQATQITAEQAIQATVGATTGVAVITDANGTLQQYLRGLVKLIVAKITVLIDSTQLATLATAAKQDALLAGITKVGATTVVGITEGRSLSTVLTAATTTVASGGLSVAMAFSSDFTGSISVSGGSDQTWAGADGPYIDSAQPGNLLPAFVVKRSAGTYKVAIGTPP